MSTTSAPRLFSHKDYMNRVIDHHTYYSQFVNENTINLVQTVFGLDTLKAAYAEDVHFNSIPLKTWENLSLINESPRSDAGRFRAILPFNRKAVEDTKEWVTRSTLICIIKAAALQVVLSATPEPREITDTLECAGCEDEENAPHSH